MLEPEAIRLDGRVALVTGAAAGIGRAIAQTFARFGADLGLCDRDAEGLARVEGEVGRLGRRALCEVFDVREEARAAAFCRRVARELGSLDVLVNNAGGGFHAPFLELSARGQDALVRENFGSAAHFARAAVPLMPGRGGSVINVTSVEAHRAAPGYAVYAAMKAALANLSRSLALELGPRGVRVNCIAPDRIPTPGVGPLPTGGTALPGPGRPEDVAAAALFLASDLSRFVTGTTVHVDGGVWAAGGWRRGPDGRFQA